MDFHDLAFVEALGDPGPSKSGVGRLGLKGLNVSCSNAFKCYVFGFVEAAFVFSRNASTKSEAPTPPGQFLEVLKLCEQNGLHMFKWLGGPGRKTFSEVV